MIIQIYIYNRHSDPTVFLTYLGNMVAACCPQSESGTLSSFSALTLLLGCQEGYPACESSATTIPKSLLLGTGLRWSNLTWSNTGEIGQLNKIQEREREIFWLRYPNNMTVKHSEWLTSEKQKQTDRWNALVHCQCLRWAGSTWREQCSYAGRSGYYWDISSTVLPTSLLSPLPNSHSADSWIT